MLSLRRFRVAAALLIVVVSVTAGLATRRPASAFGTCGEPAAVASAMVGWAYFAAWSVSFYPQMVLNFERKSVVGLSFDFALLNTVGFACYSVFNACLFYSASIRAAYAAGHDGHASAVRVNDVFFAFHAFVLSCALLVQIALYPRGNQTFSRACKAACVSMAIGLPIVLLLAALGKVPWLDALYTLSYVKLAITLCKYVPQVWLNMRRHSTAGWNIDNVVLDFIGGTLSVGQLLLDAGCSGDWSAVSGDPVKFGLGFSSMFFDTIFFVQHWVLYRPTVATRSGSAPLLVNVVAPAQEQGGGGGAVR